jgi:hypothetical protein
MDKETESQLHCSYSFGNSGSAFLRFQPVKKELVSLNPYIVMFHDIISDQDIESITQIAKPTVTINDILRTSHKKLLYRLFKILCR